MPGGRGGQIETGPLFEKADLKAVLKKPFCKGRFEMPFSKGHFSRPF